MTRDHYSSPAGKARSSAKPWKTVAFPLLDGRHQRSGERFQGQWRGDYVMTVANTSLVHPRRSNALSSKSLQVIDLPVVFMVTEKSGAYPEIAEAFQWVGLHVIRIS